jgi:hypothetical protein
VYSAKLTVLAAALVATLCAVVAAMEGCGSGARSPAPQGGSPVDAASDSSNGAIDAETDAPLAEDAVGSEAGCEAPDAQVIEPTVAPALTVIGDTGSTLGIFDPSVLYPAGPAGADGGVLSYSTVPTQGSIFTRVAVSSDNGATWTKVADANQSGSVTVATTDMTACGAAQCTGTLVHEVSSIVADGDDVPARRFKLFFHTYVVLGGTTLRYDWGHIGMETAPAPGGPWSAEVAVVGWTSSAPALSSQGALFDATGTSELSDCFVLTEPGAIWRPGVLDLALGCVAVTPAPTTTRIVLLRSTDQAATWSFVTTLLSPGDATCVGASSPQVNAADLFTIAGAEYLVASPVTASGAYDGCLAFAIDDPTAGTVRRDAIGVPIVLRYLGAPGGAFSGACSYAEGATADGYFMPQAFLGQTSNIFRVFLTGVMGP